MFIVLCDIGITKRCDGIGWLSSAVRPWCRRCFLENRQRPLPMRFAASREFANGRAARFRPQFSHRKTTEEGSIMDQPIEYFLAQAKRISSASPTTKIHGVLFNATIGVVAAGTVYGHKSARNGSDIRTSLIVDAYAVNGFHIIETRTGSNYLLARVGPSRISATSGEYCRSTSARTTRRSPASRNRNSAPSARDSWTQRVPPRSRISIAHAGQLPDGYGLAGRRAATGSGESACF